MSLQTKTARNGGGMFVVAEETHQQPAEAEAARIEAVERGIRDLNKDPVLAHKSTSQAIGEQAMALLTRANAHISESFDALQKKLDDLRRMQGQQMANVETSIRAAMEWNDYMTDSMNQLDKGIDHARGDLAKLTKS